MKYQVGNSVYENAYQAACASVEMYITANGNNSDEEIAEVFANNTDAEILKEMRDNEWTDPVGVTTDQMRQALSRFRSYWEHKSS